MIFHIFICNDIEVEAKWGILCACVFKNLDISEVTLLEEEWKRKSPYVN